MNVLPFIFNRFPIYLLTANKNLLFMRKQITAFLLVGCLVFLAPMEILAQTVLKGRITDEAGAPVPGATIKFKNKPGGTVSGDDGTFTLPSAAKSILIVSGVGFSDREINITDQQSIDVRLVRSTKQLDEVVVTALGMTRQKKALGYAIQEIKGAELTRSNEQNILNSLSGKIAGVQVTSASGAVGSSSRIVLRGNNSFTNNQPLFVVDGVPVSNFSTGLGSGGAVDYGNAIAEIDPNNIASVSVLKGANAAALYGYQAGNGVILITTKNGKGLGKKFSITYSGGFSFEKMYILPHYQNEYGQGFYGDEYSWKQSGGSGTYQQWAETVGFSYLDGLGNGINDGVDESWGPRLNAGLNIKQYNSPLDAGGARLASPWLAHPNNVEDFFVTGYTIDNSVSLSTNSDKGNTRLSLSHQKQAGTVPNTDQKRYTLLLNTTQNFTDRLKSSALINYVRTENDNLTGQGYNNFNPMQSIGGWFGRQVDMLDLKANYNKDMVNGFPHNWNSNFHDNPFFNLYNNTHSRIKDRLFGNATISYKVHPWATVMLRAGGDFSSETRKEIMLNKSNLTLTSMANKTWGGGRFTQRQYNIYSLNADLILTGGGNIYKGISLNYTAGANYLDNKQILTSLGANELTVPNLFTISNTKGTPVTGMSESHARSNSVFGQASFGYEDYLYLDLTARNDWNSSLPMGNWSYFYPSASLSWIFTKNVHINPSLLSYGKLRASWAKVGNGTSPYQLDATYSANATGFNGVSLYSLSTTLPPINLLPESAKSIEIGTELQFAKGRFGLDATYYTKTTTNQIMRVNLSGSTGYTSMLLNAGEIENKGLELQVNLGIIRSVTKKFEWDMSINWAKNSNKVNKLYEDPVTHQKLTSYNITSAWSLTVDAIPGEAWGTIRGASFLRNNTGAIIVGPDGLPKYNSTPTVLGNITPDWVGGVTNDLSYKNFHLNFLVDFRKGGDIFSVTQWFGYQSGVIAATAENGIREKAMIIGRDVLQHEAIVKEDGNKNDIPVIAQDYFHSLWGGKETSLIDGSFIKLRQIELGYTVPAQMMRRLPWLQGANISLFAFNVALLHTSKSNIAHIDPETGFGAGNDGLGIEQYQIPSNRSIGIKLNFTF
jgi:TonB-linked SusC/RagA family outer membrane protein